MKLSQLFLFTSFVCGFNISTLIGQIEITAYPQSDLANCQLGIDVENHPDYIAWLNDNGGGEATTDCPTGTVTWTVTNVSVDTNQGCYGGNIYVTWQLTDDCGFDYQITGDFDVYTNPPTFDVEPSDLILDCGDPNNQTLFDNWVSSGGYATGIDDCTPSDELEIILEYGQGIPDCGDYEFYTFLVKDTCAYDGYFEGAMVNVINTKIDFSSHTYSEQESTGSIEFCLDVTGADLQDDVSVDVEILNTSTAINGTDYEPLSIVQTYTIPAGPPSQQCYSIEIYDDILIESDETIWLELSNLTSSLDEAELNGQQTSELIIEDDDDDDGDGVENSVDSCPVDYNPFQEDVDGDGFGDECDPNNEVTKLHEVEDNIYAKKLYSGIILTDQIGNCWMIVVQENGELKTIDVECP